MTVTSRDRKRIQQLHAMLGSQHAGERENAMAMLLELLQKLRLTWNDLPGLLATGPTEDSAAAVPGENAGDDPPASADAPNALELMRHMLMEFVELRSPAEYLAVSLWALHTHVFDRFLVSPRLALLSPVRGCGKTTLLELLERLSARPMRTEGISAAAIYHLVDYQPSTLLLDEADNIGLESTGVLRAVLNSGHRKGGSMTRLIKGKPKRFTTFSPMAIAAIGDVLPLPIMARSIVLRMQRAGGSNTILRRIDDLDAAVDLDLGYRHAFVWARTVELDLDPEMPAALRNRTADNWRVLLAIADSFGPQWGVAARKAALTLAQGDSDEDVGVMLLMDIRDSFDELSRDRLFSAELIRWLINREDASWGEFRGVHGNQTPRPLSAGRLATVLRPFGIRPRPIWPPGHKEGSSKRGYLRAQFEAAWARYCPQNVTPSRPGTIRRLREEEDVTR